MLETPNLNRLHLNPNNKLDLSQGATGLTISVCTQGASIELVAPDSLGRVSRRVIRQIMADPAGLISLGLDTIKGILRFYEGYKEFDKDVAQTWQTVSQLHETLLLVQPYLSDGSARLETRQQISSCICSSSKDIERLQHKLEKIQGSPIPPTHSALNSVLKVHIVKSLYPFRRSTLAKLIETTADSQARLQTALSVLGLDKTTNCDQGISNLIADNRLQQILEWLPIIDFPAQKDTILRKATPGTGSSFLGSSQFKSFIDGSVQTLFCSGPAGAGKTFISCIAIRHLSETFSMSQEYAICYVLCNHKHEKDGLTAKILSSLVSQLIGHLAYCPTVVLDLWNKHMRRGQPAVAELVSTLKVILGAFDNVFLLIDAMDEFHDDGSARRIFMETIQELQKSTQLKLLVTARPLPDITAQFNNAVRFQVSATDDDLRKYLAGTKIRLEETIGVRESLYQDIANAIVDASDGIFLVAALHMESVLDRATSPSKAHKAIQNLSRGQSALNYRYEETMERIRAQPIGRRDLAERALRWITLSRRHLTAQELTHALAIEIDDDDDDDVDEKCNEAEKVPSTDLPEFDEDNVPNISLVVSSCLGLIVVGEKDQKVDLSHFTVHEFFKVRSNWIFEGHALLGKACIRYLSSANLVSGGGSASVEYPLRQYAADFFGIHTKLSGSEACLKAAFALMTDIRRLDLVGSLIELDNFSGLDGYHDVTGVHLAAYYGLTELLEDLLASGQDVNRVITGRFTPLSWAVNKGHVSFVKKLLDLGAVITHQDVDYDYCAWNTFVHSPITMAIFRHQDDILKQILLHHSMRHITPSGRRAALKNAAFAGQAWVVQELLRDDRSWAGTPGLLAAAAGSGDFKLVDLLLSHGAHINDETPYCTSILHACFEGRQDMVRYLLDRGAKIPIAGTLAEITLRGAVFGGVDFVAEELLLRGVNTECMPLRESGTVLDVAVYRQHSRIVSLLLRHGARVASTGLQLRDLYFPTTDGEAAAVVAQLNLMQEFRTKEVGPAIQLAALTGNSTIMSMLLQEGGDPNTCSDVLGHVLQVASRVGAVDVVGMLVDHGSDLLAPAGPLGNALAAARDRQHAAVECLLTQAGAKS